MLKRERLARILQSVNEKGTISVSEITEKLKISDMTARRDLDELEKAGKLIRFHGGAQSIHYTLDHELTHKEKSTRNLEEKTAIARYAVSLVEKGDTVFLGPGTTIELLARALPVKELDLRVITTSYPVFEYLSRTAPEHIILAGGQYRSSTGSFVGPLCNEMLQKLKFHKAFFSCNGISGHDVTTSSLEEGENQKIALNHARRRYLLADHEKFSREDFFVYYSLYNLDLIVTDEGIREKTLEHYREFCQIEVISLQGADPLTAPAENVIAADMTE